MKRGTNKILAIVLSVALVFGSGVLTPTDFQQNVQAQTNADIENSLVTEFSYDFAYSTPGYADGTIWIDATEDGVYRVFWGDAEGNKLTKNGYEYSYLAKVVVKDGKGSYNITSDYTAIPEGAETVLVYRKGELQYVHEIPENKLFMPTGESYTFGALSDLHFGRYSSKYDDDAVPAADNAFKFLDSVGIDFVGTTGDLTSGGEQSSLDKYNTAFGKYPGMTVLSCVGNHDSRTTVSTSNSSSLDTALARWYNSITSSYFTVDEDGTITSKLDGHEILASDAITDPITVEYRAAAGEEPQQTTVPGLDFVTEAGGNIFIFLNAISHTGTTYDTDKLVTTGQLDWLEAQLETYKDEKVFLFFHSFLGVNTLSNDAVDYDNCVGDLKNQGGYSYDLDFKDEVTTTSGLNMKGVFNKYTNLTMFSGHSHWQYAMQEHNPNLNIGRLNNGNGATLVHLSSVTEPRYIGKNDNGRTELNAEASEGTTVTVYDDCIVYNSVDFYNSQYEAYATYIIPTGESSTFEPTKNTYYIESADAITGDEYLEAEDLTMTQLLKSNFNLTYGADYTQSSVGSENSEGKLTDGKSSGGFANTERSSSATDQNFVIDLGKSNIQKVSNINYFLLYFQNDLTNATSFNISVSLDGDTYENVGAYTNVDLATNHFEADLADVTLEEFRYVKLHLTAGKTNYGYQVKEFAVIGEKPIVFPEIEDQTEKVSSAVRNLALNKEVIVSSTYDKEGSDPTVLTDGKKDSYWSSDWDDERTYDYVIVDLGEEVDASSIESVLVNYKSDNTFCESYTIEFSKTYNEQDPTEGFYEVAKTKAVSWEILQKYADKNGYVVSPMIDIEEDNIRYVKVNMNGHKGYGYQVYEIAVIAKEVPPKDITDDKGTVTVEDLAYVYSGEPVKPTLSVQYDGITLVEDTDYIVELEDNVNAGTAKYTITGIGAYTGTVTGEFVISAESLENVQVDDSNLTDLEFEGKDKTPIVKLSYNGKQLNIMADYEAKYENNFYPGTATITITGIGNFTGEIVKTFKIVKRPIENVTVRTSFDANNNLVVKVNNGSYAMTEGEDYSYTAVTDATGKITITLTGLGDNYSGTSVKVIEAKDNPNKPQEVTTVAPQPTTKAISVKTVKINSAKNAKGKKAKISWKKLTGAKGYEIRYSTNKKFKKAKIKKIKKNVNKYTIKKLKLKKYYIQVRAYEVHNGKKYFGKWSKKKTLTIKK